MKMRRIDSVHLKRAALILIAAVVFISLKGFLSPVIGVGSVLQKTVVGLDGGESVIILQSNSSGISVEDPSCGQIFPEDSENLQINESLETELKARYPEIRYIVRMRLCTVDEIREYRVSREDFNRLDIGMVAKYEVYRSERDVIKRIIEV